MYKSRDGFTIVELLVVIVVIGVLATIISVSYSGISEKANHSALKMDAYQAGNLLAMYQTDNDSYPDTIDLVNNGHGLPYSDGVTYSYTKISDSEFCLTAKHEDLTNVGYFITQDNRTPTSGFCPGDAPPLTIDNSVVATTAGSGAQGFVDGSSASAQFNYPSGITVDSGGYVYIADYYNHRIRKITPAGVVSTLAGNGTAGFVDGSGTSAQFRNPRDLAFDSAGNIYVADTYNHSIRKVTPAGVVSTLAGSGVAGFADGTGAGAQFNYPQGVVVDILGDIYVADTNNHRIRKITPAGIVSTLAGSGTAGFVNGTGASAQFNYPKDVTTDSSSNVYVADNISIRKITPAGVVSTLAGSTIQGYVDATGSAAQFASPSGIDIDSANNIYVVDRGNHRIRKVTLAGVVSTVSGSGVSGYLDGASINARFRYPKDVFVDSNGSLYIADTENQRIRKISLD